MNAKYYVVEKINGSFSVVVEAPTHFGISFLVRRNNGHVIYTDNIDVSLACINARGEI